MNPACGPAHKPPSYPDPERAEALLSLGDEITELSAHLDAGTYQLLQLIGRFDQQERLARHGHSFLCPLAELALWLESRRCPRTGPGCRALPGLPKISAAFREGRVSYSKVRAMTRVATAANEDVLLDVALGGTASHVERQVRVYRNIKRSDALKLENLRHTQRELSWFEDDDGSWVFKGRFTPEQGALISKALDAAMEQLFTEQKNVPEEVSAETSRSQPLEHPVPQGVASRRADALQRMAEAFLSTEASNASSGDRYLVNIHTAVETLKTNGTGAESALEDGGRVSAETSRRLSCDCSVVQWRDRPAVNRSTLVANLARFHRLFAAPYNVATAVAASRAAPARTLSMPTTSSIGPMGVKLRWKTWCCCAAGITGWCMKKVLVLKPDFWAQLISPCPAEKSFHPAPHRFLRKRHRT